MIIRQKLKGEIMLRPVRQSRRCWTPVVNSLHERIKTFLRARRGVATKYLDNYLRWFHLAELQHAPTPRACLNAAIGPQLKMVVPT